MAKPGVSTLIFRAVETNGAWRTSENPTITFHALPAPKLSIRAGGGTVSLALASRANLGYGLQVCTDLQAGLWRHLEAHTLFEGPGSRIEMTDPVGSSPQAFYRLVEY